ncbi:MAG: hypothetical protein IM620_08855 [Cytophagales bacterium]|nr:hypothetical protein [Cytophagales bacterium]
MFIYYVYAYLRSDGTPYYIGKGKESRAFDKHRKIPVPKNKSRIVFLETNLSEVGALALERRYIRWYGRKDLDTGILRNRTDGGEGSAGAIISEDHRKKIAEASAKRIIKEETRRKLSEAQKGKSHSEETRRKMRRSQKGRVHSEETRRKMSETRKGRIFSEEHRRKMSQSAKSRIFRRT